MRLLTGPEFDQQIFDQILAEKALFKSCNAFATVLLCAIQPSGAKWATVGVKLH